MSAFENENGRIEGIDAPAGAREKSAEFDAGSNDHAEAKASETPSFQDASLLNEYEQAGHGGKLIRLRGKEPVGRWRDLPSIDVDSGKRWMAKGGNVGFRMSNTDLVIDIDPRHFPEGDDVVARFLRDFDLPPHPFVLTGGGGRHLYFRKPADLAIVHTHDDYSGVEFSTLGRYVVAAGSVHPDTGRLYSFDDDPLRCSLSEAPMVPDRLLEAIRKPTIEASSDEPGAIDPELLAEWLEQIDPTEFKDQRKWQDMMMACHHATNGMGGDEFIAWSTSDPDYSDHGEIIRRRWDSLDAKPNGITIRTLIGYLPKERRREAVELVNRTDALGDFADYLPAEIVQPTFMEKAGRIESNYRNTQRAVEAGGLGVSYDELANRAVLRAERLPWTRDIGRELNDDLIRIVREWIMEQFGFEPKKDDVSDVLFALATKNTFNPVVEYLDGLAWDGVERVDILLPRYFGSADGAYERAVGRKLMLAAVRRARHPGTKFDTVPILEGKQGSGKTSALRILGGRWHSDAELGRLDSKDAPGILHDVWLLELGELTSMGKADVDHLKAFVSRMEDRYRPPYGKTVKTYPRRCVFVGTTNSNSYLQDLTGNRRFLPVQTGVIDLEALKRDRDQLWAEASRIEAGGESLVLPESLWSEAALRQDERLANDPWVDVIKAYLAKDLSRTRYSSQELLEDALGVPCNRQNQREAKRLSAVMAKLGFQHKANVRVGGLSVTGYISADDPLFGA